MKVKYDPNSKVKQMSKEAFRLRGEWIAEEIKAFGVEEGTRRVEMLLGSPDTLGLVNAMFNLMAEAKNGKYGYICMTCGKTIPEGVNKDGECEDCGGDND